MKSKGIIAALTILLALLCTSGSVAAQKTRLQNYITYKFYVEKIRDTASRYGLSQNACAQKNVLASRNRYDIISQPVFVQGKLHPIAGAWYETVHLTQCRQAYKLHITVIAKKDGSMPDFIAKPAEANKKKNQG